MDMFTKFNRKEIQDRQIDTLIGLSKGITADGKVDQAEAEFLLTWLVQNQQACDNPIIANLVSKVAEVLDDGVLDREEALELFALLEKFTGEPSEFGELAKSTSLPVDEPAPIMIFEETSFLFTGQCIFGTRKRCQEAVESLGGINAKSVTKKLDYLVLGKYVTSSWAHETFGRKIEKAIEYREKNVPLMIVTEEHWIREAGL